MNKYLSNNLRVRRQRLQFEYHQQIKETPAINYSSVKRIIASRQDYNPPVKGYNTLYMKGFSGQNTSVLFCIMFYGGIEDENK